MSHKPNVPINDEDVLACNELDFWLHNALGNRSRPTEAERCNGKKLKIVEYGSCPKQEGRVVRHVEGVFIYLL